MDIFTKDKINRLRTWKECDYFKAQNEIYNKVKKMEQDGTKKTNIEDYYKLLYDYKNLNEEYEKSKQIEKKAKKKIEKINNLWKDKDENPMNFYYIELISPITK